MQAELKAQLWTVGVLSLLLALSVSPVSMHYPAYSYLFGYAKYVLLSADASILSSVVYDRGCLPDRIGICRTSITAWTHRFPRDIGYPRACSTTLTE